MRSILLIFSALFLGQTGSAEEAILTVDAKNNASQSTNSELVRAMQAITQLKQKIQDLETSQKVELARINSEFDKAQVRIGNVEERLRPVEAKLTKITEGWFLIRSPMTGNASTYILDVRGGSPDGNPVLQLVGDSAATPQANRKFQLQLLD